MEKLVSAKGTPGLNSFLGADDCQILPALVSYLGACILRTLCKILTN